MYPVEKILLPTSLIVSPNPADVAIWARHRFAPQSYHSQTVLIEVPAAPVMRHTPSPELLRLHRDIQPLARAWRRAHARRLGALGSYNTSYKRAMKAHNLQEALRLLRKALHHKASVIHWAWKEVRLLLALQALTNEIRLERERLATLNIYVPIPRFLAALTGDSVLAVGSLRELKDIL